MKKLANVSRVSTVLFALFLLPDVLHADVSKSFYIEQAQQRFFDHWQNSRTFALAGAAISTSKDSSSTIGNPAGLAFLEHPDLSVSYDYNQTGAKDGISEYQHIGNALIATPVLPSTKDWGSVGFGWSGLQGGPDDFPINSEHRTSDLHFAYAKSFGSDLSLGYGLTSFRNQVYSNRYNYLMNSGLRHTIGIQKDVDNFSFGVHGFLGRGVYDADFFDVGENQSSVRQEGIEAGLSYTTGISTFFGAVDYSNFSNSGAFDSASPEIQLGGKESGRALTPKLGAELNLTQWLTARAGCRYLFRRQFFNREELNSLTGNTNSFAWSTGVGVKLPILYSPELAAGFEERQFGRDNRQFIITLSVPFE